MPRCLAIGLLVVCSLWTAFPFRPPCEGLWAQVIDLTPAESRVPSSSITERAASGSQESVEGAAPQKAYDLLAKLQQRGGEPLPGYVGGRDFQNRERRLPRGRYREYDVNRKIPGGLAMLNVSSSSRKPERPITQVIITAVSSH